MVSGTNEKAYHNNDIDTDTSADKVEYIIEEIAPLNQLKTNQEPETEQEAIVEKIQHAKEAMLANKVEMEFWEKNLNEIAENETAQPTEQSAENSSGDIIESNENQLILENPSVPPPEIENVADKSQLWEDKLMEQQEQHESIENSAV